MNIEKYETTSLWKATLAAQEKDAYAKERERLRSAYYQFRKHVAHLVADIRSNLPGLTVHDITHLDALWGVAEQIAGPNYPLNPAEAFVLGGAFLLHDSAHAIAAFPGGKAEIKKTKRWSDLVAQNYAQKEPAPGSNEEKAALFQVLRHLHGPQAEKLLTESWTATGNHTPNFLLEDTALRNFYGEMIGEIAASHHRSPQEVTRKFSGPKKTAMGDLPTEWTVDRMKIAFLLRTADAAHVDDRRAPQFLFALQKPQGISEQHWRFQSKLGQPTYMGNGELNISSSRAVSASTNAMPGGLHTTPCK